MIDRKRAAILVLVGTLLIVLAALPALRREPPPTVTVRDAPGATYTPSVTPNWPTVPIATLNVTIDGSLVEWSGVYSITLNSTTAANIQRVTPLPTNTDVP